MALPNPFLAFKVQSNKGLKSNEYIFSPPFATFKRVKLFLYIVKKMDR